jgi:hypothetical protein
MNQPADNAKQQDDAHRVQGEGDYDAARRYDKATTDFAKSGKVDEAARDAKPTSPAEADELRQAEAEGKSHAKGEDPALYRPGKDSSRGS